MRTFVPQQLESLDRAGTQSLRCAAARTLPSHLVALAALFTAQFFLVAAPAAQTPANPAPAHAPAHHHRKPAAHKPSARAAVAPAPAAPQIPNWPADKKPAEATVSWDSRGLLIQASNSSLDQILREVSLKTGTKVEGMGADERIFGTYGPGPASDVLTELLDGSGYNILLIGDRGQGAPRRIVLSGRPTVPSQASGNANPGASNESDTESEPDSEQSDANPPVQPPMPQPVINSPPGVPVRTPQQMLEQRQLQMQQMQQMQQQQQQSNQQNPQN